jgi:hypothetical protein
MDERQLARLIEHDIDHHALAGLEGLGASPASRASSAGPDAWNELPSLAALSPSLGTGNPTLTPLLDQAGIPFDSLTVEER